MPHANHQSESLEEIARKAALIAEENPGINQSVHDDTESEESSSGYDTSDGDCTSSSYLSSGEERKLMSMFPKSNEKMKRCSSMPSFQGEMSTMQVAILLNQVRIKDEEEQRQEQWKGGRANRRHSMTSPTTSDMSTVSAPGKLVNCNLPHIQGVGMGASEAPSETEETAENPFDLYSDMLKDEGYEPCSIKYSEIKSFFLKVTADRMSSYSKDIISAVKSSDLNFLRMAHFDLNRNMNCCNRFGESVLHTACRHSNSEVVRLLIEEAKVDIRVCDDFGRTPCHDAAWQGEPNMELVEMILLKCPDLLLIADKRGFTPLQYVRKAQWPAWNELLKKSKNKILPKQLLAPTGAFVANTFVFSSSVPGFDLGGKRC